MSRARTSSDSGFSLVELLVAIGIFGVSMAIVSVATVSALQSVRRATASSDIQVQQQNAIIWISRLLRYADNPIEGAAAVPWVQLNGIGTDASGNSSLTFTTYSGTGPLDRVAYQATLAVAANGDLVSTVATPQTVAGYGSQCWRRSDAAACASITEDVRVRTLIRATTQNKPRFTLAYVDSAGAATTPPTGATAQQWAIWASKVGQVKVTISDSGSSNAVSQTVILANPR